MSRGRRIFIGDVQGCREPLERLLEACDFDEKRDRLFFTGDLVNKGPESANVLRMAIALGAESVLGNHDVFLLELAHGRIEDPGNHTLEDLFGAPDRRKLLSWLLARPLAIHLGDIVLVHAALKPTWRDTHGLGSRLRRRFDAKWQSGRSPFDDSDVRFALTARFCTPRGRQADPDWPPPGKPFQNWLDFYRGPETVVFGHFARQGLVVRDHIRGLDTGCCYGKQLTAWIAEEDRVVVVSADPTARTVTK